MCHYTARSCVFNTNYFVVIERKLHNENGSQFQKRTFPGGAKTRYNTTLSKSCGEVCEKSRANSGPNHQPTNKILKVLPTACSN